MNVIFEEEKARQARQVRKGRGKAGMALVPLRARLDVRGTGVNSGEGSVGG